MTPKLTGTRGLRCMALLMVAWLVGCAGRTLILHSDRRLVGDAAAYVTTRPADDGEAQVEVSVYGLPPPAALGGTAYVVWAGNQTLGALRLTTAGSGAQVNGVLKTRLRGTPGPLAIRIAESPSGAPLFFY